MPSTSLRGKGSVYVSDASDLSSPTRRNVSELAEGLRLYNPEGGIERWAEQLKTSWATEADWWLPHTVLDRGTLGSTYCNKAPKRRHHREEITHGSSKLILLFKHEQDSSPFSHTGESKERITKGMGLPFYGDSWDAPIS